MRRSLSELHLHNIDTFLDTMSTPEPDENEKRQHLWKSCKIVSKCDNGSIKFHKECWERLKESVNPSLENTDVALVGVIGPKSSGKSFYTNLIIQYFRHNGTGGWLTKLMPKPRETRASQAARKEGLKGFAYGDVRSSDNLIPDTVSSGIYFYPEPFVLESHKAAKYYVWVVHLHYADTQEDNDGVIDGLHLLMNLICSRITEIHWNQSPLHVMDTRRLLTETSDCYNALLCDSIVVLVRSNKDPKRTVISTKNDAAKYLQKKLQLHDIDLKAIKYLSVVCINNSTESIHETTGQLRWIPKVTDKLEKVVRQIADENEIHPKTWKGGYLTFSKLGKFIESCVKRVNIHNGVTTKDTESLACSSFTARSPSVSQEQGASENGNTTFENSILGDAENTRDVERGQTNEIRQLMKTFPLSEGSAEGRQCGLYQTRSTAETKNLGSSGTTVHEQEEETHKELSITQGVDRQPRDGNEMQSKSENTVLYLRLETDMAEWKAKYEQKLKAEYDQKLKAEYEKLKAENESWKAEFETKLKAEYEERMHADEKSKLKAAEEARLKAEEEARVKAETEARLKAEQEIEHLAASACGAVWHNAISSLHSWVSETLNLSTIKVCETLYDSCLEQVEEQHKVLIHHNYATMSDDLHASFRNKLHSLSAAQRKAFTELQTHVELFDKRIRDEFEAYCCFAKAKLELILETHDTAVRSEFPVKNDHILHYLNEAMRRLAVFYRYNNEQIVEHERRNAQILFQKVREYYYTHMQRFLANGPYGPDILIHTHKNLVTKLHAAFKDAFPFELNEIEELQNFRSKLWSDFENYKQANVEALLLRQKYVSSKIDSFKKQYDVKMNDIIEENPKGISIQTFDNTNNEAQREYISMLERDVQSRYENEPCAAHKNTLKTKMDKAWVFFQEANESNWKRHSLHHEDQLTRRKPVPEPSTSSPPELPSLQISNALCKSESKIPPIIFQLSLTTIVLNKTEMTEEGKEIFVTHEDNETRQKYSSPTVIGLTKNNTWLCGNEVTSTTAKDNGISGFHKVWSISECLAGGSVPWSEEILIEGNWHKITVEFLLGILLHDFKTKVEEESCGVVEKAFITIPFWMASSHRQQIKDAGKIAGFGEFAIVNENTAAAYTAMYNKKRADPDCHIVIFSENSGTVGVSVFSFESAQRKLKMRGYSEIDGKQGHGQGIPQQIFDAGKYYASGVGYSSWTVEEETRAIQQLDDAWKKAWKETEGMISYWTRSNAKHVRGVYESEKWKDVFEKVGQGMDVVSFKTHSLEYAAYGGYLIGIGKRRQDFAEAVRERVHTDIWRQCVNNDLSKILLSKDYHLPVTTHKMALVLPENKKEVVYFQQHKSRVYIGELKVPKLQQGFQVDPTLEISHDGIVSLKQVQLKRSYWGGYKYETELMLAKPNDYKWSTPNLSEDQIVVFSSLMDHLKQMKVAESKKTDAKQTLIQKCDDIEHRISSGIGKFKTQLGRNMVSKQVCEILALTNHPRFDMADIDKQMEILKNIEFKYFSN